MTFWHRISVTTLPNTAALLTTSEMQFVAYGLDPWEVVFCFSPPHSANLSQQWLQRYCCEILLHPALSPDLATTDFPLFGLLKLHLGGMAFETEDDLVGELKNWFAHLNHDFLRVSLRCCCPKKCIDLHKITLRSTRRATL